jgi:hypothetical protein
MLATYSTTKIVSARKLWWGCMDAAPSYADNFRMAKKAKFPPTCIRKWRRYRERTLEDVAAEAGMTAGNLSQLELGQQGYTQAGLERLARALKTDPGSLLDVDPFEAGPLWPMWRQAKPADRKKIVDIVKTITETDT